VLIFVTLWTKYNRSGPTMTNKSENFWTVFLIKQWCISGGR